jgi:hypothetical protein
MPRLSTLSNPTGLVDLEKQRISIVVDEHSKRKSYCLLRLDLNKLALPVTCRVIVIARRASSEIRVDHGLISDWNKSYIDATELSTDGTWSFRVLLVNGDSPAILAAAENVRPNGLGISESLIALEPADLGQVPWQLLVLEQEGRAVIQFNNRLFATTLRAEADPHFGCYVFPLAVRELATWIVNNASVLGDDPWIGYRDWLTNLGVNVEHIEDLSDEDKKEWIKKVEGSFCNQFRTIDQYQTAMKSGEHHED